MFTLGPYNVIREMSTQPQDSEKERNVEVVRRLLEQGFGKGNLSVVDDTISKDLLEHQRFDPMLPPGPLGMKALITGLRKMFSDFEFTIEDIAVDGSKVWSRSRASGTNSGSIMGKPPTGMKMKIEVFDVCKLQDDKIVEHWGVPDQLGMLEQIGLVQ